MAIASLLPALRRLSSRVLLATGGLVLGLLTAELFVRATGLAPELAVLRIDKPWGEFVSSADPDLRYIPAPGGTDINALGFRDREHAEEKAPGTLRILVLGDSVAYGFCDGREAIPVDALFSTRLEALLDRPERPVEVLNLGVSGYDSLQEEHTLALWAPRLQPDLVLVAVTLNDATPASAELVRFEGMQHWEEQQRMARILHGHALVDSHLFRFVLVHATAVPPTEPDPDYEGVFKAMRRQARQQGFALRAVLFPTQLSRSRYPVTWEQALTSRIEDAHIPLLSLKPTLYLKDELYTPCNAMHPNAEGHAAAAEAIAPFVEQGLP